MVAEKNKELLSGQKAWFTYKCLESEESNDAILWHHTNQPVTILKRLTNIDECEVGRMYSVKFNDGLVYDVFEDELSRFENNAELRQKEAGGRGRNS